MKDDVYCLLLFCRIIIDFLSLEDLNEYDPEDGGGSEDEDDG